MRIIGPDTWTDLSSSHHIAYSSVARSVHFGPLSSSGARSWSRYRGHDTSSVSSVSWAYAPSIPLLSRVQGHDLARMASQRFCAKTHHHSGVLRRNRGMHVGGSGNCFLVGSIPRRMQATAVGAAQPQQRHDYSSRSLQRGAPRPSWAGLALSLSWILARR
ncbi:hypothetical protein B0H15DRAFT_277502 [Mycena belliarum]|uniref:Uncharacterized protein n=1 Tax=Mycena belliarum TaxID=1033014 RepID=A0AAD6TPM5_9AGAR|nr:hypothetical protein B0H15DRAFT_277502 [Mycena belliae]